MYVCKVCGKKFSFSEFESHKYTSLCGKEYDDVQETNMNRSYYNESGPAISIADNLSEYLNQDDDDYGF